MPIWVRDFRSPEQYDESVTRSSLVYTAGSLLFSPIPGILADYTGSYVPAYLLFTVCSVFAFLAVLMIYKGKIDK